ncbi:MAG: cytidine deaminase [Chloroflexota bacterium]|jgi:cytidine deaminase|nr:cytidine deaminase [Anaerolineae bacterium]HMM29986.1 cytidine deaminase [Aggregatilineaceae bacterium]
MSDNATFHLTDDVRQRLISAAADARVQAYVPYSHYPVGAAILTASGAVFTGCNVENATYGATICGERTATVKAVSQGEQDFQAVAVVTSNGASPCGICRQVLYEFGPEMTVVLADEDGAVHWEGPLSDLLPLGFGPKKLAEGQAEAARD